MHILCSYHSWCGQAFSACMNYKRWKGLNSFSLTLQVCLLSCHMCKTAKCCVICVQGILLDEASGVSRTQQPVMPAGYQPPKIVVSSWNRRVGFSAHPSFNSRKYMLIGENVLSCELDSFDHVLMNSGWSLWRRSGMMAAFLLRAGRRAQGGDLSPSTC